MQLFLTIVAAVFVSILLLVFGLFIALKLIQWRVKKAFSKLGEAMESLAGAAIPPARVHLTRLGNPDWNDKHKVDAFAEVFRSAGYEDIGTYEMDVMPDAVLLAMMNSADASYATIYDAPKIGVWVDLIVRNADGTSFTLTSNDKGAALERPPEHPMIRLGGASADQLLRRWTQEREAAKVADPVAEHLFKGVFEKAYAQYMDWRLKRGFATPDEIRAVGRAGGNDVSAQTITLTAMAIASQERERLDEVLREKFLEMTPLSAVEWERARDRLIFVHDRLDSEEVRNLLASEEDPDLEEIGGGASEQPVSSPRELFAQLNDRFHPERRLKKLAILDEPIPADVYERPVAIKQD